MNAVADGYAELELIKRHPTAGTGASQGRHSALATAKIMAEAIGRSVAQIGSRPRACPSGRKSWGCWPVRSTAMTG